MNKTTKKIVQIFVTIAMLLVTSLAVSLVKTCNGSVSKMLNKPKEPDPIERVNDFASHINSLCPIYFESWAKIESCTINQKNMYLRINVDDDFVESYNQGTFILAVHQQFENEINNIDLLKSDMEKENITIILMICKTNGENIDKVVLRPKDVFDSPIVKYEEDRNLERTLQEADIASKITPYSY